ncbi:MAG: LURP-one-related family protein [Clostridiaceae bacterium]|nr:LURP-one-related family protein [Clostridiaceae bacterium]
MKLYIKQRVFSWADRFTVKDENGFDRYSVEGELFSWGKKLHVYDTSGQEAVFIREKVWSFRPRYYVSIDGQDVAEIVREFTFLRPRYYIEGVNWEIEGSFWAHDYEITREGRSIVTIHKEWMTWGDCYELNIADARDEILALAVVLTIDCVMASAAAASAANN